MDLMSSFANEPICKRIGIIIKGEKRTNKLESIFELIWRTAIVPESIMKIIKIKI